MFGKLAGKMSYFQVAYVVIVVSTMFAASFGIAQADAIDTLVNKASFVAGMVSMVVGFLMLLVIGIQVQMGAAVRSPAMIGGRHGGRLCPDSRAGNRLLRHRHLQPDHRDPERGGEVDQPGALQIEEWRACWTRR